VSESTVDFEQSEEETLTDEVSDETLEATASRIRGELVFTFSINIFYCRFC
jgi:hypothetical protein